MNADGIIKLPEFKIALISASIPAIVTIIVTISGLFINFWLRRRDAIFKNRTDKYSEIKNDLAVYIGLLKQCYYDSIPRPLKDISRETMTKKFSDVMVYAHRIKLELNPARDQNLSNKIDEINEVLFSYDHTKITETEMNRHIKELYNLGYITLAAMKSERFFKRHDNETAGEARA